MNKWLKGFSKVGLAVGSAMVPQIALAEDAFTAIKQGQSKKEKVTASVLAMPDIVNLLEGDTVINKPLFLEGFAEAQEGYVKMMQACQPKP